MYSHSTSAARAGRVVWSIFRHPVKSLEFPAEQERLATPADLIRYHR